MSTAREFWKLFLGRYRWMPREDWDALVRGDTCPMCSDVEQEETRYGFLVARLETSNLHLSKNQYASGYCVLMYRGHAIELHQVPPEKQAAFMRDLLKAGAAIARVFNPIKMNYQLLGNLIPHLHWHLIPRYYGDPAPGRPLDWGSRVHRLKQDEYERIIADLRKALAVK
jgi:diadenosine tetraphosphate (Ap4A) HIT family hydrolase